MDSPPPHRQDRQLAGLYILTFLLHGVVDPAITYYGVVVRDEVQEANPIMARVLQEGGHVFVLAHIPLLAIGGLAWYINSQLLRADRNNGNSTIYWLSITILVGTVFWGVFLISYNIWTVLTSIHP